MIPDNTNTDSNSLFGSEEESKTDIKNLPQIVVTNDLFTRRGLEKIGVECEKPHSRSQFFQKSL